MSAPVFAWDSHERRTVRTPALVWFGPRRQVRCEIIECNGERSLRASEWAAKLDGWHRVDGIRISGWGELVGITIAVLKSWVVLLTDRRGADRKRGGRQ